jgi:hypothetical protein
LFVIEMICLTPLFLDYTSCHSVVLPEAWFNTLLPLFYINWPNRSFFFLLFFNAHSESKYRPMNLSGNEINETIDQTRSFSMTNNSINTLVNEGKGLRLTLNCMLIKFTTLINMNWTVGQTTEESLVYKWIHENIEIAQFYSNQLFPKRFSGIVPLFNQNSSFFFLSLDNNIKIPTNSVHCTP